MTQVIAAASSQTGVAAPVPPARPDRPAVWIACCLAAGIFCYSAVPVWAEGYAAAGGLLALMSLLFLRWGIIARLLLCSAIALCGVAMAQLQRWYVPADSALPLVGEESMLVRARVEITDLPIEHAAEAHRPASTATTARLLALHYGGEWHAHSGRLLLRIEPAMEQLGPRQVVEVIGMLRRIAPPENPGQYDWREHFARSGIVMRLSVTGDGVAQIVDDPGAGWLWTARKTVRDAMARGFRSDQQLDTALLQALLLGDSNDVLEQTWADFRASGTAHHLSISGMHIAVLCSVVLLLCRATMRHPRTAVLIAVSFALLYGMLTRSSPPVWRSVFLCMAVGASMVLRRNTDPLQCLFVAVLAMLAWNPLDLLNPGFQLSFGTVAGLMLFARPVAQWMWSFEHEHDRMARRIRPPGGWAGVRHWMIDWSITAISAGLVAYAVSMPLIALHFSQINPWAIPGSIVLAPFVYAAMLTGLAKIVLTLAVPSAAGIAAIPAAAASHAMRSVVGLLAKLPGAELAIPDLAPWLLVLCGVLLLMPVLPRFRNWRLARWGPVAAVALVMMTPALAWAGKQWGRNELRLTMLSVGNGSCTVVEFPDGRNVMIDCGAIMRPALFEQTIAPFLKSRGITHLDRVLATHEDSDHVSGIADVEQHFQPTVYRRLYARQGVTDSFEVLAPALVGLRDNDASAVIRLTFGSRRILFTGDIEEEGIRSLLASGEPLRADVLVAPHHGSCERSTGELLERVAPEWILCSSSRRLSHKQKRFDEVARGQRVLRTGQSGAITVVVDAQGAIHVETCRRQALPLPALDR